MNQTPTVAYYAYILRIYYGKKVLKKKVVFYQLQTISNVLYEKNKSMDRLPAHISSSYLPFFKFALISSLDVERYFSKYFG
jgi:hypothetical protein